MIDALDWCNGICWSLVYILAIVVGFRKKTYCIPGLCVCLNFSWELLVLIQRCLAGSFYGSGFIIQAFWLLLDIGVLATWIIYDYKKTHFVKMLLFVVSFAVVYWGTFCANMWVLSAFAINLLMSVLFLYRGHGIWSRKSIALLKMIGTAAASVLDGFVNFRASVLWIGGCCLIFDFYYIFCLINKEKGV